MTIVVDASALVAMARREPEAEAMERVLDGVQGWATPVNIMEAGLILVLREGRFNQSQFQAWVADQNVAETHTVTSGHALAAYLQYGKGVHRAGLNMGDCFAYALARQMGAPLLYKGNDFVLTDVKSALQPT
jgi:ribonuclease VapC